jgi:polysaccharide biosynthesis protein PslH
MMPLALWIPATIPKLFIHHQIHFVYAERVLQTHGTKPYSDYLTTWMSSQEQLYLRHYDGVIAFSEVDRAILSELPGIREVYTSPFPIPVDVGIAQDIPPAFDGRFLFLGSENWGPNRESLQWLLRDIWPLIVAELPLAKLEIIGEWTEGYRKTVKLAGVSFKGFVPDLTAVLRGGTMLVPLRIGSGVRTKILVSLAQGVPVISTPVGAEGLLVRDGEELLVRDTTVEFAKTAVRLAGDPELWKKLALAGRNAMAAHYSGEVVRRRRNEIYAGLAERSLQRTLDRPLPVSKS